MDGEEIQTEFSGPMVDFRTRKSITWSIVAVLAALFAITNIVGIPGFSSLNQTTAYVSGALFGPWVTAVSYVIGEVVTIQVHPMPTVFVISTITADILYSLMMGYGRNLAKPFQRWFRLDFLKSRTLAEGFSYILMLLVVATFYTMYDMVLVILGLLSEGVPFWEAFMIWATWAFSAATFKMLFLPLNIILVESIRKGFSTVYFDKDPKEFQYSAEP